jgi:predicted esterase
LAHDPFGAPIERTIATSTHGRYLVSPPASSDPAPMLIGFHGYAESAETQLERLRAIPGSDRWLIVSVQGLHRFYERRRNDVIASWMTRQDREQAIADNLAYVHVVADAVSREWNAAPGIVFAGFSQGVAMAFRSAVSSTGRVDGVIAAGGDVPPEIDAVALARAGRALVCRGARDEWYSPATFENDQRRLREARVMVTPLPFDGKHEWSDEVSHAASLFLRGPRP